MYHTHSPSLNTKYFRRALTSLTTNSMIITHTTSIPMPDGTLVEVDLSFEVTKETNPFGKEPAHYSDEDDGWEIESVKFKD